MGYRAFFSYSRANEKTARWLHKKIDSYRTPKKLVGHAGEFGPVPSKLHPIFRDRSDLSSGGNLGDRIQKMLQESEALIVLCSPETAKSEWVNREVEQFIALGRHDKIFPVISAELPNSDDIEEDFYPPALRGRGVLAADLREIKQPGGKVIGDNREVGRLKLTAGLLGIPLDLLMERERVAQRSRTRTFALISCVFAALAVVAIALGFIANSSAELARKNEQIAERRAALLSSDAARAHLANGEIDAALLLLLEASKQFTTESVPDDILIAFDEVLVRATTEQSYPLSPDTRLFDAPTGIYLVGAGTGDVDLFLADGTIRSAIKSEGHPIFVGALPDGETLVVRDDRQVERHSGTGTKRIVGEIPEGLCDLVEGSLCFEILPNGSLKLNSMDFDESDVIFDTSSGKITSYWDILEAEMDGSPDLNEGDVLVPEDCSGSPPENTLAYAVEHISEMMDQAYQPEIVNCQARGDALLVRGIRYFATGQARFDLLFLGYGSVDSVQEMISAMRTAYNSWGVQGSYKEGDFQWVDFNPDTYSLSVVSNRDLLVTDDDGTREWRMPSLIRFFKLLPDGRIAISAASEDRVRIINPADVTKYSTHTLDRSSEPEISDFDHNGNGQISLCGVYSAFDERLGDTKYRISTLASESYGEGTVQIKSASGNLMQSIDLSSAECLHITRDGKFLLRVGSADRQFINLLDSNNSVESGSVSILEIAEPVNAYEGFVFLGDGPDFLRSSGAVIERWDVDSDGDWSSEIVYRGTGPILAVESDKSGKRILIREEMRGRAEVASVFYSLEAGRVWRRLVRVRNTWTANFKNSEEIVVNSPFPYDVVRVFQPHSLEQAVAAAREQLSPMCKDFNANNFTDSRCWPVGTPTR